MRTIRPDRFALTALRGDMSAVSSLVGLLLLVQLLVAGFATGAASAGLAPQRFCAGLDGTRSKPTTENGHADACLCLTEGCCRAGARDAPPEPALPARTGFPAAALSAPHGCALEPERRPLALFARAGRSPPPIA